MIDLPRSLARRFQAVWRRCFPRSGASVVPIVVLRRQNQSLGLEAITEEVALRLETPTQVEGAAVMAFSGAVLAQVQGTGDQTVTLTPTQPGQGCASWDEAGRRQEYAFALAEVAKAKPFPVGTESVQPQPQEFLTALAAASQTAPRQKGHWVFQRLLWRGQTGQMVATDGQHLLVQAGFCFPWSEEILVPPLPMWDHLGLGPDDPITVGRSPNHVFVRAGPWTIALRAEPVTRYPDWEAVVPRPQEVTTRLRLEPSDLRHLLRELPRLPGSKTEPNSLSLHLGATGVIVARGEGPLPGQDFVLSQSQVEGPPVSVALSCRSLVRALRLGQTEVGIVSPNRPLAARDAQRILVWMPLDPKEIVPPSKPSCAQRKEFSMSTLSEEPVAGNGSGSPPVETPLDPLAEAEAVRSLLQEVQSRLGRLITALKQHRRQTKALQAAVASLRHLPPLAS